MNDRGEVLLDLIYDYVDFRLNPDNDECWYCGGDGEISDCFDGCCINAEYGCSDCTRQCPECHLHNRLRARLIREEVIKSDDIDVAVAWLKSVDRWHDGITPDQVRRQMDAAKAKLEPEKKEGNR